MKNRLIPILLILTSCHQTQPEKDKTILNFGAFTIETPPSWNKIKEQGTDSYVGRIAVDSTDTLDFDLGWYSNKLYERDLMFLDSSMIGLIDTSVIDPSGVFFVKDRTRVDPDKYRKNNISWDTIDNRKAKIVYPRKSGIGITGVYIDSLWISGTDIDRFNLYGENLKPENEKKLLSVIKTLKFYKKQ